jgi:hypothetical protein
MTYALDHIAVVCADLSTGADWLSEKLGVPLLDGGEHARFGTYNKLLGLAEGLYLEVISPKPAAQIDGPRWFNLDHAPAKPRWGNWICRTDNPHALPDLTGPAISMARGGLEWEITVSDDGSLPMDGGFPTLIKWADETSHPAASLPNSGCRLVRWEVQHPQADRLRKMCPMRDGCVVFTVADAIGFRATFDTPTGIKVIS